MVKAKDKATPKISKQPKNVIIPPLNLGAFDATIVGIKPYVQLRFSEKAKGAMRAKHEAGSTAAKGKKREKRDFKAEYQQAMYKSEKGWRGIPASAFRNAMISACRTVGFQMTKAKLAVWVEAHGMDPDEETPLIKIIGKPEMVIHHVRNATGVADLRVRALWREWKAVVPVRFDADMFTYDDVVNLLARVGMQVGIGEGRPDSKASAGMGWGLFRIV